MYFLKNMAARFPAFFRRKKLDADMAEEMSLHLERRTQSLISEGLSPEEARYAAQRQFGGVEQLKELAREQRGTVWLAQFIQDLRFAWRQLLKTPGFTLIAVLSLALGIGAATSVFTLVESVLLRSLPVPDPHELRVLQWSGRDTRMRSLSGDIKSLGDRQSADAVSLAMFFNLREKGAELADIFGFSPLNDVTAQREGGAFAVRGMLVSDNFFSGLGTRPLMGSLFTPGQAAVDASAAHQVVITHDWWQNRFAADPAVLGQAVTLNGGSFTIVGVLPRKFPGVRPGDPRHFYVMMTAQSQFLERPSMADPKDHWWVRMMARLHSGNSDAQLKAALDVVFPTEAAAMMKSPEILVRAGDGGLATDRDQYRKPLLSIMAVVGLLMLVACANLAGLSLARGAARHHELAIRAAIGAGRWRLLRQSLTESLLLALLGGGLGVAFAIWGKSALSRLLAGTTEGVAHDLSLNLTVLGFGLAAAVVTGVLSGLLPALQAGRVDPVDGLKTRGVLSASKLRAGRILVAAQIALSMVLLTGGGLYLRTLLNLRNADTGFNAGGLLLFSLNPNVEGKSPAQIASYYERLQDALLAAPGVQTASPMMVPLLSGKSWSGDFTSPGRVFESPDKMQTHRLIVGERFFATMGIPITQGRALNPANSEAAPRVVVVNETFARRFFPGENTLGIRVRILRQEWTIVGVSRDTKYKTIREPAPPTVYFSFRQYPLRYGASFAVRTSVSPLGLANAVREIVASIDPTVPVTNVTTQEQLLDRALSPERVVAALGCVLAGLALLLACIGLYGLMSFNVARRQKEIAIRMAIGAQPREVALAIVREALWLVAAGIGVGLPVVLGGASFIESQLYGVPPQDTATLITVIAVLMAVALLAAWLPARRATRVDPLVALRAE
jgi:predicted permease